MRLYFSGAGAGSATARGLAGVRLAGRVRLAGEGRVAAGAASSAASSAHCARQSRSIILGTRWMTTFRKLPTSSPSTALTMTNSAGFCAKSSNQTTAPSLKIGRYIAMTRPPTSTPRIAMISGSSSDDIASTALSTSAS